MEKERDESHLKVEELEKRLEESQTKEAEMAKVVEQARALKVILCPEIIWLSNVDDAMYVLRV